jgi:S-layer protein (TIGR01564 family)
MKWKKIAAVGAGVLMGITTLAGALAADLNEYPVPFIADGKFNAIMVIGANAQPIDNIGVTNIATSLKFVDVT